MLLIQYLEQMKIQKPQALLKPHSKSVVSLYPINFTRRIYDTKDYAAHE